MTKLTLPPYELLVDTNALYSKDLNHLISPGFDAALGEAPKTCSISLCLPDVVRNEIIARRVRIALKSRESIQKAGKNLSVCTGLETRKVPSESAIRTKVSNIFDKWLQRHNGSIIQFAGSKVVWNRIMNNAVWRKPPFEPAADEEDKSKEKGFKDALICETVTWFVRRNRTKFIAFVSNDNRVQECLKPHFSPQSNRMLFGSIGEFISHLKILHEKNSQEYAREVIEAAKTAFFTDNNPNSLYYSFHVFELIRKKCALLLDHPVDKTIAPPELGLGGLIAAGLLFPEGDDKYYIGETILSEFKNDKFNWKTLISIVRLFQRRQVLAKPLVTLYPDERIRVAKVWINWSSDFDLAATIKVPAFVSLEWGGDQLESADFTNKSKYGFPLLPLISLPPQLQIGEAETE